MRHLSILALPSAILCVLPSCATGPTPTPRTRRTSATELPTGSAVDVPSMLSAALARRLGSCRGVSCIAVADARAKEGQERSDFGVFMAKSVAAYLSQSSIGDRVRFYHLPGKALVDRREYFNYMNLSKSDAELSGEYSVGHESVDVIMRVKSLNGYELASAQSSLPMTPDVQARIRKKLRVGGSSRGGRLDKAALISGLYHMDGTDPQIEVTIRPTSKQYHFGDLVSFCVKSNVNGYLSLWNIAVSGDLAFLAPNEFVRSLTIRADHPCQIPTAAMCFEIFADAPAGWDRAKAIVTRKPIAWPKDTQCNVPSESIESLQIIKQILDKTSFGEARCEIEIVP